MAAMRKDRIIDVIALSNIRLLQDSNALYLTIHSVHKYYNY